MAMNSATPAPDGKAEPDLTTRLGFGKSFSRTNTYKALVQAIISRVDIADLHTQIVRLRRIISKSPERFVENWFDRSLRTQLEAMEDRRDRLAKWVDSEGGGDLNPRDAYAEAVRLEEDLARIKSVLGSVDSSVDDSTQAAASQRTDYVPLEVQVRRLNTYQVSAYIYRLGESLDNDFQWLVMAPTNTTSDRLDHCIAYFWGDTAFGRPRPRAQHSFQKPAPKNLSQWLDLVDKPPGELLTSLVGDADALSGDRQEVVADLAVAFIQVLSERDPSAVVKFAAEAIRNGDVERFHPRVRDVLADIFHQYSAMLRSGLSSEVDSGSPTPRDSNEEG
jgi:hypothetical protein